MRRSDRLFRLLLQMGCILSGMQISLCDSSLCSCDLGPLCPPPPFPNLISIFGSSLELSQTFGNLSRALKDGLPPVCKRAMFEFDWDDFNNRLCLNDVDGYELPVPYSDRHSSHASSYSGQTRHDSPDDVNDETDDDRYIEPVGSWMAGSGHPSSPSDLSAESDGDSLWWISRELVAIISIGSVLLLSTVVLVVFCLIRLRQNAPPKYDAPQEELLCLRWMPQQPLTTANHYQCSHSVLRQHPIEFVDDERMPANVIGHPVKRYL